MAEGVWTPPGAPPPPPPLLGGRGRTPQGSAGLPGRPLNQNTYIHQIKKPGPRPGDGQNQVAQSGTRQQMLRGGGDKAASPACSPRLSPIPPWTSLRPVPVLKKQVTAPHLQRWWAWAGRGQAQSWPAPTAGLRPYRALQAPTPWMPGRPHGQWGGLGATEQGPRPSPTLSPQKGGQEGLFQLGAANHQ